MESDDNVSFVLVDEFIRSFGPFCIIKHLTIFLMVLGVYFMLIVIVVINSINFELFVMVIVVTR